MPLVRAWCGSPRTRGPRWPRHPGCAWGAAAADGRDGRGAAAALPADGRETRPLVARHACHHRPDEARQGADRDRRAGLNAEPFTIEIIAAVAAQERRLISRRTKDALAAAKARGVKLGGYRLTVRPRRPRHSTAL